ncbi:DUF397 domain-containing protein [Actinomycetes bacterium KLBMP 9797]
MTMAASAYTNWRKSTRSGGDDNCVEVDTTQASIGVRDSKNPDGAILEFDRAAWDGFIAGAKTGEFDL